MAQKDVIITTFEQGFDKWFYDELVVGQLAKTDFKDGIKRGDEVNVYMPSMVTLSEYDGGTLGDPELADKSFTKITIDKAASYHFEVDEVVEKQIQNAPDLKQRVNLASEYAQDATKQAAAKVDESYAQNYTRAGVWLDGGNAVTLTKANCIAIFAYMAAEFKRGDDKGHNNWIDGSMYAIVPPEYEYFLTLDEDNKYTESGQKKVTKGYVGKMCGWNILVSNQITKQEDNYYYPLFGLKGKTLAGGVAKTLHSEKYRPDRKFTTCYKGYTVYGTGCPRADLLGAAKLTINLSLS